MGPLLAVVGPLLAAAVAVAVVAAVVAVIAAVVAVVAVVAVAGVSSLPLPAALAPAASAVRLSRALSVSAVPASVP